jgi:hypothetical protein
LVTIGPVFGAGKSLGSMWKRRPTSCLLVEPEKRRTYERAMRLHGLLLLCDDQIRVGIGCC